jgi:hypothetical protein
VFRRFSTLIAALALLHICGGHWAVLQTTAWVTMVIGYSQEIPLVAALEKTFDGAHPCELCLVVKKGQSEEQKQQIARNLVKLEAVLAPGLPTPLLYAGECRFEVDEFQAPARTSAPPVPPPLWA